MKIAVVPGIIQRAGHFPQRLAHQPGLQPDVAVAHLAFELRARHQRRHRVDHHDVKRTRADQHVGDLECLFPVSGWLTSSESVSTPSFLA